MCMHEHKEVSGYCRKGVNQLHNVISNRDIELHKFIV